MRRVNFVKEAMKKLAFDGGVSPMRARFWWGDEEKKEETVVQTSDRPEGQSKVGGQLGDWASKYLDQYVPGAEYGGPTTEGTRKLSAPISTAEKAGYDQLMNYLGTESPTGDLFKAGKEEILKTLTGKYDPRSSEDYKAFREGAVSEESDLIDRMRRGAGYRGTLFQDTSGRDEGLARSKTSQYLDQLLATMSQKERQNKLDILPQALGYEKYETAAPLAKASAGLTLGSLPRMLEQADLEAQYKDFLRKQEELGKVPGVAQNYYGTQGPNYGYNVAGQAPSPFERIMGTVAPVAGSVLGSFFGPIGTAVGGAAGKGVAGMFSG